MKKFFCLLLGSIPLICFSQVNDSFEDGDFSSMPTWSSVNTSNWVIDNGRLRSNAQTINTSFYISTPSTHINETQWEFSTQLQFNTSGANYVDVFLTADNENLSLVSNGYFVRIGGTPDEISLYKMQGGLSTILINGRNGSTNKSNNTITVKVKHTLNHEWTLERDTTGVGQLFFVEGTTTDSSINLSTHFGIRIAQSTASFFNKHFFDDIKVEKLISDTLGPTISKITPLSRNSLQLTFNEKVSSESATNPVNYQVNSDNTCIAATLIDDEQTIELLFEKTFINAADNGLKATNIDDVLGNRRDSTFSSFFFFEQEPMTKRDIIFSEIMADPIPSQGLPEAEYIELYNRSNNVINIANLILKDASASIQLPSAYLYPSEYVVITSSSAISSFGTNIKIVGLSPFPTLSNAGEWLSITNSAGEIIDSISYSDQWYGDDDKKSGGYSLERINQENTCLEDINNWLASTSERGGSPGLPNSILDNSPDLTPPSIKNTQVLSNDLVEIIFSEKLNPTSVLKENFQINPERLIHSVFIDTTFFTSVQLKLVDGLTPSQVYTLAAMQVSDCSGNSLETIDAQATIVLPEWPEVHDIIITEIFPDPQPTQFLPEGEFVEIYNRSDRVIDLRSLYFSDNTTRVAMPRHLFYPNDYLILTSEENKAVYESFGKVIGINNFPVLNNSGELLKIARQDGIIIDSVNYNLGWYKDDDKKDGGWTLERRDLENFCLEAENWQASKDQKGGTPGRKNSVYTIQADTVKPFLQTIQVADASSILLNFNEQLADTTLNKADYSITPLQTIVSLQFASNARQQIAINFSTNLDSGSVYEINIHYLKDCSGNISTNNRLHKYGIPVKASFNDVVISEIMVDPGPVVGLPESEYVEIYNRTMKLIDISQWKIVDETDTATLPPSMIFPESYTLLIKKTLASLPSNLLNAISVSDFISLSNVGEKIQITNIDFELIDSLTYSKGWHDEEKQDGGWSLEKIDLQNFCIEESKNWKSSLSNTGGTPGYLNSVAGIVSDTLKPRLLSVSVLDSMRLLVSLSEKISSDLNETNILIDPAVQIETLNFTDKLRNTIMIQLKQPLAPGVFYSISLNMLQDCSNNMADSAVKVQLILSERPAKGDIVISEIFADPSPSVALPAAEFVEIYNRSDKIIDLHHLQLSDGSSTGILPNHLIFPKTYVLLVSTQSLSLFNTEHKAIAVQNFPTLNNDGELLVLKNTNGKTIDSVDYKRSWYRDEDKAEGGWSLERIDLENFCLDAKNWAASEDESGGSPGRTNAIAASLPDQMGPKLIAAIVENSQTLVLSFDERLSRELPSIENINISPLLEIERLSFKNSTLHSITLHLSSIINEGILYEVETKNIYDCAGNKIDEDQKQVEFVLPQEATTGDVLINEILFNPNSGGADFVEIYNSSPKYLSLRKWQLGNVDGDTTINNRTISDETLILRPYSYLVVTSDTDQLHNHYPQGKRETFIEMSIPSFPDEEGTVAITDSLGNIFDFFMYMDDMHNPLLKDEEGVSLERVSTTADTNLKDNWRSGVVMTGFATPGLPNANAIVSTITGDEVIVDPEIFEPTVGQPNFATIHYKFSKPGLAANAKIYDARGREIKQLANNQILAAEGFFTWDGDQEDGTKANIGYYTLWLEVFDTNGFVKTFRKRIVIATRF